MIQGGRDFKSAYSELVVNVALEMYKYHDSLYQKIFLIHTSSIGFFLTLSYNSPQGFSDMELLSASIAILIVGSGVVVMYIRLRTIIHFYQNIIFSETSFKVQKEGISSIKTTVPMTVITVLLTIISVLSCLFKIS